MILQKIYKTSFRNTCKKTKNDLENGNTDDEDFREEGKEQHSFNESMIEINPKWTPIKYQLRTDLNTVSVKTKEKLVRKSNQAVERDRTNL